MHILSLPSVDSVKFFIFIRSFLCSLFKLDDMVRFLSDIPILTYNDGSLCVPKIPFRPIRNLYGGKKTQVPIWAPRQLHCTLFLAQRENACYVQILKGLEHFDERLVMENVTSLPTQIIAASIQSIYLTPDIYPSLLSYLIPSYRRKPLKTTENNSRIPCPYLSDKFRP